MNEKKLLVADDSLTIQKVIRLALSNEGYQIQTVSDGNEATQQIAVFQPDVVLVDISLPGKNAVQLKRETDAHGGSKPIRFILMSSAFEPVNEAELESLKFDGSLIKPFDPAHLRKVLNEVLVPARTQAPAFVAPPAPPPFASPPPVDLPVFSTGELWDKPPPAPSAEQDIKELTEETIRLSGLDRPLAPPPFNSSLQNPSGEEWAISEPARTPPPPPPRQPRNAPSQVGERTLTNLQVQEPSLQPPPFMKDNGGNTFDFDAPLGATIPSNYDPLSVYQNAPENSGLYNTVEIEQPTPTPVSDEVIPLTTGQMEELISKQLGKSIEQVVTRILPEIAERILREEIQKMLADPPRQ